MKKRNTFCLSFLIFLIFLLIPTPNHSALPWNIIAYDDQSPESYLTLAVNDSVAVRFSSPANIFRLTGINLYCNTTDLTKIVVWVLDANLSVVMGPFYPLPALGIPPYEISFGDKGPIFVPWNATDFYVVIQWVASGSSKLGVGIDTTSPAGRSYTNQSSKWRYYATGNVMIHARIDDIDPPSFDHIPLKYAVQGKALSISVEVSDEFGVESVTLAYRVRGSTGSFSYISLTRASGSSLKGIWFGQIPGVNITSAGIEYYIWATDIGFNQRYYGNATTPFEVEAIEVFEMPLLGNIIIILAICAATIVVYLLLPKYEGEDLK